MLEFNDIFVPVDISGPARTSVGLARSLAGRSKGTVRLVHAVPNMFRYFERSLFPYAGMGDDKMAVLADVRKAAQRDLARFHKTNKPAPEGSGGEEARAKPCPVDVLVGEQGVSGLLSQRLSESAADLVVVGRSGAGGAPAGRLGSVAAAMCAESSRPVLITRDMDQVAFERVVVALDLGTHSQDVLAAAIKAAIFLGTTVCIVCVVPPVGYGDVGGIVGRAVRVDRKQVSRRIKTEVNKALDRIQEQVELPFSVTDRMQDLRVERKILLGDPVGELVSFTSTSESDLLVLGSTGQGSAGLPRQLGRVAESLAACAPCHVLVVPPG